ncbi:hypothetical protein CAAU_1391 [Caloramator australicus RC3]|uniref:Uncharacterized protein n=1 Tax=Caloramator australicus RC3 TaxID=857293 RepID=I7LGR7_9CLOT|nr:hypothetical protein CAAU_1391 [Caloramator australicus RC3]
MTQLYICVIITKRTFNSGPVRPGRWAKEYLYVYRIAMPSRKGRLFI